MLFDDLQEDDDVPAPDFGVDHRVAHQVDAAEPALGEDDGVSDPAGIVRIWVEQSQIIMVRVSSIWYQKITERDSLENHFRQAFFLAALRSAAGAQPATALFEASNPLASPEIGDTASPITYQSVAAHQQRRMDFERRFDKYLSSAAGPEQGAAETVGRSAGVLLKLDHMGRARSVEFDPDWLDMAQASSISIHVLRAAEAAYRRFRPVPAAVAPELAALQAERAALRSAFSALLSPSKENR